LSTLHVAEVGTFLDSVNVWLWELCNIVTKDAKCKVIVELAYCMAVGTTSVDHCELSMTYPGVAENVITAEFSMVYISCAP